MSEPDADIRELATRLFALARSGTTDELAADVDAGVNVNLTNQNGDTLLMLAAYHGHVETVRALLERGGTRTEPTTAVRLPWPAPCSRPSPR